MPRTKLDSFCNNVRVCIRAFDRTMLEPESPERGRKFAKIMNALELELDEFERYHKADYKKQPRKKKVSQ